MSGVPDWRSGDSRRGLAEQHGPLLLQGSKQRRHGRRRHVCLPGAYHGRPNMVGHFVHFL